MGNPTKEYIFKGLVTLSFLKIKKKGSENVPILLPLANPPDAAACSGALRRCPEIFGKKIKLKKWGVGGIIQSWSEIYTPLKINL